MAQHAESQRLIAVQCKATETSQGFLLSIGCEAPSPPDRDEWFILVRLQGPDQRPDFYVVPRNVTAAYIYVGHRAWLTGSSKSGKPHQNTSMRVVEERAVAQYRERWDLLLEPADGVPYWLPEWVFGWVEETGLPEGHPGLSPPDDGLTPPAGEAWVPGQPTSA